MEQKAITISDARLREAAGQGMDEFLQVFIDRYKEVIGGELNAENMGMLNGEQISLLAYSIFREEVMDGGFIQLILQRLRAVYLRRPLRQGHAADGGA